MAVFRYLCSGQVGAKGEYPDCRRVASAGRSKVNKLKEP